LRCHPGICLEVLGKTTKTAGSTGENYENRWKYRGKLRKPQSAQTIPCPIFEPRTSRQPTLVYPIEHNVWCKVLMKTDMSKSALELKSILLYYLTP